MSHQRVSSLHTTPSSKNSFLWETLYLYNYICVHACRQSLKVKLIIMGKTLTLLLLFLWPAFPQHTASYSQSNSKSHECNHQKTNYSSQGDRYWVTNVCLAYNSKLKGIFICNVYTVEDTVYYFTTSYWSCSMAKSSDCFWTCEL